MGVFPVGGIELGGAGGVALNGGGGAWGCVSGPRRGGMWGGAERTVEIRVIREIPALRL